MSDPILEPADGEEVLPVGEQPVIEKPEAPEKGAEADSTPAEEPAAPDYVTKDDLKAFRSEVLDRAGQNAEKKIKANLRAYEGMAKFQADLGAPIDPAVQEKARAAIINAGYLAEDSEHPQQNAQADDQWAQYVSAQLDETFTEIGVQVNPGDPEWKPLEQALSDPNGSLAKVLRMAAKQAEIKKERVASKTSKAKTRVGSSGGTPIPSNDITKVTDSAELYNMGEAQLRGGKK